MCFEKVIVLIIYVSYLGKQKNVLFETIRIVLWWKAMETILLFPLTSFYYKSVNYFARDQRSDPSLPLKGIFFCETNPDPLHKSLLIFCPAKFACTLYHVFHLFLSFSPSWTWIESCYLLFKHHWKQTLWNYYLTYAIYNTLLLSQLSWVNKM